MKIHQSQLGRYLYLHLVIIAGLRQLLAALFRLNIMYFVAGLSVTNLYQNTEKVGWSVMSVMVVEWWI